MAPKSPELLGLVLSILRQMARWTQGRLERVAGLGQGAVSRLEHGKNLDRRLLDQLAAILGQPAFLVQGLVSFLEPYFAPEESIGSPADLNFRCQQIQQQLVRNVAAATEGVSGRTFRRNLWKFERAAATTAWAAPAQDSRRESTGPGRGRLRLPHLGRRRTAVRRKFQSSVARRGGSRPARSSCPHFRGVHASGG